MLTLHVPEKTGPEKSPQIWCYIKMYLKEMFPSYVSSNCHINCLPIITKNRNDFCKTIFNINLQAGPLLHFFCVE